MKMSTIISKEDRQMIWKDECGDEFLLLKYTEVYRYSKVELALHIFLKNGAYQLQKEGLIYNFTPSDDSFIICRAKVRDLPRIMQLGRFKKRPHINGKWIEKMKETLAHDILPYNPAGLRGARERYSHIKTKFIGE